MKQGAEPRVDDQEIALRMMDRDEEGLRLLLRAYGGKVIAVLRKRLGQILTLQDFNEALNDAALKAFRSADKFDDNKGSLFTWFYRIAHNCALDIYKKERRHAHDQISDDHRYQASDACVSGQTKARCSALRDAVEELPKLQKHVMLSDLAVGGEASNRELARRLGTTANSVAVSRVKARAKLNEKLRQKGFFTDQEAT